MIGGPGNVDEQLGDQPRQSDQIVPAVQGRTQHDVMVSEQSQSFSMTGARQRGQVRAHQEDAPVTLRQHRLKGLPHAEPQILSDLRKEPYVMPLFEDFEKDMLRGWGAGDESIQRQSSLSHRVPAALQGVQHEAAVERGRFVRGQGRTKAGLHLTGDRSLGEQNQGGVRDLGAMGDRL